MRNAVGRLGDAEADGWRWGTVDLQVALRWPSAGRDPRHAARCVCVPRACGLCFRRVRGKGCRYLLSGGEGLPVNRLGAVGEATCGSKQLGPSCWPRTPLYGTVRYSPGAPHTPV
jgi:hypothetical protein